MGLGKTLTAISLIFTSLTQSPWSTPPITSAVVTCPSSLVDNCVAHGEHDWVMDALIKNRGRLKICGYRFDGYVGRVDSVQSYYENNLHFLDSGVRSELFGSEHKSSKR